MVILKHFQKSDKNIKNWFWEYPPTLDANVSECLFLSPEPCLAHIWCCAISFPRLSPLAQLGACAFLLFYGTCPLRLGPHSWHAWNPQAQARDHFWRLLRLHSSLHFFCTCPRHSPDADRTAENTPAEPTEDIPLTGNNSC